MLDFFVSNPRVPSSVFLILLFPPWLSMTAQRGEGREGNVNPSSSFLSLFPIASSPRGMKKRGESFSYRRRMGEKKYSPSSSGGGAPEEEEKFSIWAKEEEEEEEERKGREFVGRRRREKKFLIPSSLFCPPSAEQKTERTKERNTVAPPPPPAAENGIRHFHAKPKTDSQTREMEKLDSALYKKHPSTLCCCTFSANKAHCCSKTRRALLPLGLLLFPSC